MRLNITTQFIRACNNPTIYNVLMRQHLRSLEFAHLWLPLSSDFMTPPLVNISLIVRPLNAVRSKVTFSREGRKFSGQRHWFEWNFNDELGRAAQWYCNLISFDACRPFILNALLLKSRVKFYWDQLNIWSVASVANRKVSNPAVQIGEPLLAWSH